MMIKTITAIFLALLLTACSPSDTTTKESASPEKQEKIEQKAPVTQASSSDKQKAKTAILTIETLDGKEIEVNEVTGGLTFKGYENRAVFVVLFGYRCPPCLQEMPNLIAIMKKNYPDLEIIALEVQGLDSDELKAFKERKGINYTLAVGAENNQFINYIASRAQWQGSIPFFLAFNKKGEVKVVHVGALSSAQLEAVYEDTHK